MQQLFSEFATILDDESGYVGIIEGFWDAEQAAAFIRDCEERLSWRQETITIFAKSYPQPRLTAWIGIGLSAASRYSSEIPATPWWDEAESLRQRCAKLCNTPFNSVLVNQYRNGQDGMGMHADDEPILGPQPVIASLSLGQTRKLLCKHRFDTSRKLDIPMRHGSLMVMAGNFQHAWKHGVPKSKKSMQPRMNLTFRRLLCETTKIV